MSTLTPDQVHAIVHEMRTADYRTVGQAFFDERVARLQAAGWVLGVESYSHKSRMGKRGYLLRNPRNEWRNIAYFFHVPSQTRVFYWDNSATSKASAVGLANRLPAPALPFHQGFTTFSKPTTV